MAWSIFTNGGGPTVAVGWAKQFLQKIGAPVTPGNIEFVYQWEKSEGGGGKYNPLNQGVVQGHPELTTSGTQFGGGAADYASWDAGLQGAYDYLQYDHYTKVLAALKANNPTAARSALWASPWAASHYGYGSNWYFGPVPGGTAILPASTGAVTGTVGNTSSSSSSSSTSTSTSSSSSTNAPDTCAWNLAAPKVSTPDKAFGLIPLPNVTIGGQSFCVLTKTQVRAIVSSLLFSASLGILLVGSVVLVAYGFKGTKAGDKAQPIVNRITVLPSPTQSAPSGGKHREEDSYGRHSQQNAGKPDTGRHRKTDDEDTYGRHARK